MGVLKSYESESFISAVYVVRSEILVPSKSLLVLIVRADFFEWFLVGFLFSFGPPMVDIPLRGVHRRYPFCFGHASRRRVRVAISNELPVI